MSFDRFFHLNDRQCDIISLELGLCHIRHQVRRNLVVANGQSVVSLGLTKLSLSWAYINSNNYEIIERPNPLVFL